MEQIICAEGLGFHIAWLAELHFCRPFAILSSPLILAAALAQRTRRIRLGSAVVLLPLQHPLRVAEDAATVDLLSQGRLALGVGRGAIAIHFQGFNVPGEESRERFVEASLMDYFRTATEQLRLGERNPSPSYGYLREVRKRMEAITWEEAEATMALYGSPEQCVQKLREAHAQCGMDQVICWFNPGGLVPHRQVLASMRRFAEEVMPAVRGL
jgi:alkanesulfonate monooxygenase SsuD/methylene tetrahydromethanopterin reductase-like flavin-dependent oxidoreductase (luciferase family)